MGVGNVAFRRSDGSLAIIEEVMYVPDMRCNLMSLGQLLEKGFSASLKNKFLDLLDPGDVRVFSRASMGYLVMAEGCLGRGILNYPG